MANNKYSNNNKMPNPPENHEGFGALHSKNLPDNQHDAFHFLFSTPQVKDKNKEEPIFFNLYLNYAVNNIQEIAGLNKADFDPLKVRETLLIKEDDVIRKLSNFLWLFQIDEPDRDFRDAKDLTIMLVSKIFELRNYFSHESKGIAPLLAPRNLFIFLEGSLITEARNHILSEGLRTDKLFKLKLMNRRDEEGTQYEFTRKGLIFLVCLALYRDEAMEFCSLFCDMKLPKKCPRGIDHDDCSPSCKLNSLTTPTCNVPRAKALTSLFTYFSFRKGRSDVDTEDNDYLSFADILGHLNKVPTPAFTYLTLDKERNYLNGLKENSTESEENKEYKYTLHQRFRNRFISFIAGYFEDFDKIPSLRFKRLDTSYTMGRKRYIFGKHKDDINRNRMDRHYTISKDTIQFAYTPETHIKGGIKIKELRSAISESELKRLCWLLLRFKGNDSIINKKIKEYFDTYHRILERLLNTKDQSEISLDDYLADFATVSAKSPETIKQDISCLSPYFSKNILRFFLPNEQTEDTQDLSKILCKQLTNKKNAAQDFLTRLRKLNAWRLQPKENRPPQPPKCLPTEVSNQPYGCKISDGEMISWIFKYLNLYLTPEKRFRQLPRGEQHHGVKDHEYQLLHAAIGKYSLDSKGFTSFLKKYRQEEYAKLKKELKAEISEILARKNTNPKKQNRYDTDGQPAKANKDLATLAEATASLYLTQCKNELNKMQENNLGEEEKVATATRFSLRLRNLPKEPQSLIATILGIDLQRWTHAYNYRTKMPYQDRRIEDEEHIVTQIPFPNGFSQRVALDKEKKDSCKDFLKEETIDFNAALREYIPKGNVTLRDYYDIIPLIQYQKDHSRKERYPQQPNTTGIKITFQENELPPDYSGTALDKATRAIRKAENQDKLLLTIAMEYYQHFLGQDPQGNKEAPTSIYTLFNTQRILSKGSYKIRILPNDVTRPVFAKIKDKENIKKIVQSLNPDPTQVEFDFYELMEQYRQIQSQDRSKRLEYIPLINKLEQERYNRNKKDIPESVYKDPDGKSYSSEEIRKHEFPFYKLAFPALTKENYEIIVKTRNDVFHKGFNLDIAPAVKIIERILTVR